MTAWHLKVFRKEIPLAAVSAAVDDLQADMDAGVWLVRSCNPASMYSIAERLSRQHTPLLGTRTLDILHVAQAVELGAEVFVTADARQAGMARAAGLRVARL